MSTRMLNGAMLLAATVRLQLPLVILVWCDDGYGVTRWKQMLRFGRTSSVEFGNPDLITYARAFSATGFRVEGPSEIAPVLHSETSTIACSL